MLVIVTARNEAQRIGATVAALTAAFPRARVLLADDRSSDATAEIALRGGARRVSGSHPAGKGGAATLAAREALRELTAQKAEREGIVLLCDGDLGTSAAELAPLVNAVRHGETDLAVASFRTRVGGGFGVARSFARWAIRRRCGFDASAPISGQRALRESVLSDVLPFARGFGMELAMTIDAVRAGHRVVEIELDLAHRATGRTPAGFIHRARQLRDFVLAYAARR
jgi:glycosyltransferase involved in cell wall biosynthesis